MKRLSTEVVIAGAGLTGSVLAHLLSSGGIECIVIDQRKPAKPMDIEQYDPRAISITPASIQILSSINIWQKLPYIRLGYFDKIKIWDESSSGELNFDCADICEPVMGYIVEQKLLQDTLFQEMLCNPRIKMISKTRICSILEKDSRITVELDNGVKIDADSLVAADGINSVVRTIAGMNSSRHEYGQTAVACIVQTSLKHENIARQRFLVGGILAFLPMADPNACGIVWSTSQRHAKKLMDLSDEEFSKQLQFAFESRLGDIVSCQPRVDFDLSRFNADHYTKGRCVLVGDAAHNVHPFAGQGANMGFMDVVALAELMLSAKNNHENIGSQRILRKYERWRKSENGKMILAMELVKYFFEQKNDIINSLRGTGLSAINSTPFIKGLIMKYAMGFVGDLPLLVRQSMIQGIN